MLYYITPQVWAWGAGRLAEARAHRDEGRGDPAVRGERCSAAHGIDATFVGHPLLDRAGEHAGRAEARAPRLGSTRRATGARAVSRGAAQQEIDAAPRRLRRDRARAADGASPGLQVVVSVAPTVDASTPARCPYPLVHVGVVHGAARRRRRAVQERHDDARGGGRRMPAGRGLPHEPWTYAIARRVVKIPHIGLVNVVAGREVAREFVQDAVVPEGDGRRARAAARCRRVAERAAMLDGPRGGAREARRRRARRGAWRAMASELVRREAMTRGASRRSLGAIGLRCLGWRERCIRVLARDVALSRGEQRGVTTLRAREAADRLRALARADAPAAVASSRPGRRGARQRAPRWRDHRADRSSALGYAHRARLDVARRRRAHCSASCATLERGTRRRDHSRWPARPAPRVRARRAGRRAARRRADRRRSVAHVDSVRGSSRAGTGS